jgi:CheY-specific phosphatase CheX
MPNTKIDPILLENALWESADEAFQTTVMLQLKRCQDCPECEEIPDQKAVMGSITYSGQLMGAVTVKADLASGEKIARTMLMMEDNEHVEQTEMEDAFGEVVNLVIGGFKSRIAESLGNIDISVPTVVSGKNVKTSVTGGFEVVDINCKSDDTVVKLSVLYKLPQS